MSSPDKRILSFEDLRVYQMSFDFQQEIFDVSKTFPKDEKYSLTDQIRRASRSIGANISEAWQKRRYPAHFVSKLTDADGEAAETRHWLKTASACDYLDGNVREKLIEKSKSIGGMLGKMIANPDSFCH